MQPFRFWGVVMITENFCDCAFSSFPARSVYWRSVKSAIAAVFEVAETQGERGGGWGGGVGGGSGTEASHPHPHPLYSTRTLLLTKCFCRDYCLC